MRRWNALTGLVAGFYSLLGLSTVLTRFLLLASARVSLAHVMIDKRPNVVALATERTAPG